MCVSALTTLDFSRPSLLLLNVLWATVDLRPLPSARRDLPWSRPFRTAIVCCFLLLRLWLVTKCNLWMSSMCACHLLVQRQYGRL